MAVARRNSERVMFLARGMTFYTSRLYKSEKYQEQSSDISTEDLLLPKRLKIIMSESLDTFIKEKFVTAHNHYAEFKNREHHLKISFRAGLLDIARRDTHEEFLRECGLFIMSATELERLNFPEAKNIVIDAIHLACMKTTQYEELLLWETTEESERIRNLNNDNNYHNYENVPNNGAQSVDDAQSVDVAQPVCEIELVCDAQSVDGSQSVECSQSVDDAQSEYEVKLVYDDQSVDGSQTVCDVQVPYDTQSDNHNQPLPVQGNDKTSYRPGKKGTEKLVLEPPSYRPIEEIIILSDSSDETI